LRADVSEKRITLIIQGDRNQQARNSCSSLILFTQRMELIRSSATSVPTRARRRHMPEDGILLIEGSFVLIVDIQGKFDEPKLNMRKR
jgi:hypothetical protein